MDQLTPEQKSEALALAAKEQARDCPPATQEEMIEILMESIRDTPRQIQFLIDSIVDMQETLPMPRENWQAFIRDIEYTNRKHGWNLQVPKIEKGNS